MSTIEVTRMSSKGQVVIPGSIRSSLGIKSGTKFAVITDGESILMKPMESPKLAAFKELIAESRACVRSTGLTLSDVPKAIRRVRDANRYRR